MKVTIEPTDDTVVIDGVPCRLWYGETDLGTPVTLAVHRVITSRSLDTPELDASLEPRDPPEYFLPVMINGRPL